MELADELMRKKKVSFLLLSTLAANLLILTVKQELQDLDIYASSRFIKIEKCFVDNDLNTNLYKDYIQIT